MHSKIQYNLKRYYRCHHSLAKSTILLKDFKAGVSKASTKFHPLGTIIKQGSTQLNNIRKYPKKCLAFLTTQGYLRQKATNPKE